MDNAEKRNISKIKIAVEIYQENNNKDFWTILFAAKDRGGLILYLYFKRITFLLLFSFCFNMLWSRTRFWVLERFIEVVLTCTHNLCFEQK